MKTTGRWALVAAAATLCAALAVPSADARAKPDPGGGPATGCSALTTNPNAKGGSARGQLGCAPAAPDLRAAGSCNRTVVPSGEQISCTLEVHNDGTVAATLPAGMLLTHFAYPVGFTLNTYTVPGASSDWSCGFGGAMPEEAICSVAVEQTLPPGGVLTFGVTGITPYVSCVDSARTGDFVAVIDSNSTLAETDETNNTLTVGLTVNPLSC